MFGLGMSELILILVIALVIFGPSKLPEMGSAAGKAIREFRRSTQDEDKTEVHPAGTVPDKPIGN